MFPKITINPVFLVCCIVILSSCGDNPTNTVKEPPQLPPVESMKVDLSAFDQQQAPSGFVTLSTTNYEQAVNTALLVKFFLQFHVTLPRLFLAGAYGSEAAFLEDGKWEWTYSQTSNGETYSIRLVAVRESEGRVRWKFYTSSSLLGIKEKLFFEGVTFNHGTEGHWYYYPLFGEASNPVIEITWSIAGEDHVELKLEVLRDYFLEEEGTYLTHSFDGSYKTVVYFDASTGIKTIISWNAETGAGYIISPGYNGGQKACWDENLQDIACEA